MKIVVINGSPRKRGNTATVLDWVEAALEKSGHKVRHVHIADKKVYGCIGCYKCKRDPEKLVCKFNDDGHKLFRRMMRSDVIIYASPLYCWGFTSQMKPFIDRHMCLVTGYGNPEKWKSLIEGKRVGLLVTAEDHEGPGNTDTISMVFERLAGYTKTEIAGSLIVPHCSTPANLGEDQKKLALDFAARIVA